MNFSRVLKLIADHLDAMGSRYAVVGGIALQAHGIKRTTFDLDLAVEAEAMESIVKQLESSGFATLHASTGFSNHLHQDDELGRIDLIYVDHETAGKLFPACTQFLSIGEKNVPVVSPEHLIAMKVHAMKNDPSRRFKEMNDIQQLCVQTRLDLSKVRPYFEKADLIGAYDELKKSLGIIGPR